MHPFALVKLNDEDEFFGIFFRNTNAQSPIISHRHDSHILSYVTTGGNLDIIFFGRGTAREVISNYQRFIGLPKLPPLWALGWHGTSKMWYNLTDV
jgi:alpha-glucosidase (family GH31 glycosyl hydrolase)